MAGTGGTDAKMTKIAIALTIAGSDSSGGAGIQADLKTFAALEVYGASVVTALTAQNTLGVQAVHVAPPRVIGAQIDSVLGDLAVGAIKTGMLGDTATVEAVVAGLARHPPLPLVVDPVMVATSGDVLLADDAIAAVRRLLIPGARLITPNLPEAARLLGSAVAVSEDEMRRQAEQLHGLGPMAVLVKGGHGASAEAVDILFDGREMLRLAAPRIATPHTHGTGCTLSAAIAALLARGLPLAESVRTAKGFLTEAIRAGAGQSIGHGRGPVDHLAGGRWWRRRA